MVADPAPRAVTRPVLETVATEVAVEPQVTDLPVTGLPLASRAMAVACIVPPTTTLCEGTETDTVLTIWAGLADVRVASPVFVSTVARIVAEPLATAVTVPLGETVAMLVLREDHAT